MGLSMFLVVAVVATASVVYGRSVNISTYAESTIRVGAFNIQTFGVAKMSNPVVVEQIVEILVGYDIILIQEIRDKSMQSVYDLHDHLNEHLMAVISTRASVLKAFVAKLMACYLRKNRLSADGCSSKINIHATAVVRVTPDEGIVFFARQVSMNFVISERLGRTSYKEQYAFFYKTGTIAIDGEHQFDDEEDIFEREPFSVLMTAKETGLQMTLVALHAKPDKVQTLIEIAALEEVYYDVAVALGSQNIVILGDLNAACSYVKISDLDNTYVFSDSKFDSLIDHSADTTVGNSVCAYDRIIVSGEISDRVIESRVHLFDDQLELDQDQALKVSDHYPVEMTVRI